MKKKLKILKCISPEKKNIFLRQIFEIWKIFTHKEGWAKKLFSVKFNLNSSNLASHIKILFLVFCSNEKRILQMSVSLTTPPGVKALYLEKVATHVTAILASMHDQSFYTSMLSHL